MYLRKMRPKTTCLYSAASMLLRKASAAAQSWTSKPRLAPVELPREAFAAAFFCRAMVFLALLRGGFSRRHGQRCPGQKDYTQRGPLAVVVEDRWEAAPAGNAAPSARRVIPRASPFVFSPLPPVTPRPHQGC